MWDAVVIGSGISGLAAAAALGKRGRKVLLLGQHTVAGGLTQTFRRREWVFATGVHYLSGVGPQAGEAGQFGRLLAWLSDGALQFAACANPYDIVRLPGFEFGIQHPQDAYRAALRDRFLQDHTAIDAWFAACAAARRSAFTLFALRGMPTWLAFGLRLLRGAQAQEWATRTLADELAKIANPRLSAVLGARWGDYGAPPAWAPFVEHALITGAYDDGAYYPVGGPARFAQALLPAVRHAGGGIVLGADVQRIELDGDGRVSGVAYVHEGQAQRAATQHVISAIGARNTAAALPHDAAQPWQHDVDAIEPGVGYVALYLGLEGDIAAAGASSANHWIYDCVDIGRLWRKPADEDAPSLFVSFPSLKDPAWTGPPTCEVLAMLDSAAFAPWLHSAPGVQAGDYAAFKDWIGARLRAQFDRHFPALAPMVRFAEVATPLTQQRFVRTPDGAMYGLEMTGERLTSAALKLRTPVRGMLLAGQDVMGPGVQAAFMSGLMAAATVEPALWRELGR